MDARIGGMWSYSPLAIEHQLRPRNAGVPDGDVLVGVAEEDDVDTRYRVGLVLSANGAIERIGFDFVGSAQSVASTSFLSGMVVGRRLSFAVTITEADLDRAMGGIPETVFHQRCLGLEALRDAYRKWNASVADPTDVLVCTCMSVGMRKLEAAARAGARTVQELSEATTAGTGCGTCRPQLKDVLDGFMRTLEREAGGGREFAARLSPVDLARLELIEEVLENEVRPGLAMDGGDLEVVGLEGKHLSLRFRGTCVSCNQSGSTMRFLVEDRLHSMVDPGLEIVTV